MLWTIILISVGLLALGVGFGRLILGTLVGYLFLMVFAVFFLQAIKGRSI